jgi:exonuclease III
MDVNSVNQQRAPRLLPWLDQRQPDVVCLQETKLADDAFTGLLGVELHQRGYAVATHSETHRNGVAILSRPGLEACWPVSPGRLAQLQAVGDYRAGMFHKDPLGHGE